MQSKFTQSFEMKHEMMSQSSTRVLTYMNDKHRPTRIRTTTTLPVALLPEYWNLHSLTEEDIRHFTANASAQLLWLSCLVHGLTIKASCLQPSSSRREEIIIADRTFALKTLLEHYKSLPPSQQQSSCNLLSAPPSKHLNLTFETCPFPEIQLPENVVCTLIDNLHRDPIPCHVQHVSYIFNYRNHDFLPIMLHKEYVYLRRITPCRNVVNAGRIRQYGMESVPPMVIFNKQRYVACEDGLCVSIQK